MLPVALSRLIKSYRYRHSNERDLQDGLVQVFEHGQLNYARECNLGEGDVIDFLIEGGIGVEVKVGGGLSEVTRQLHRYAGHDLVKSLILVTSRGRLDNLPGTLRGKPLTVVVITGAFQL